MKLKLDENMPRRLVDRLQELGHEVDTVAQEGLTGRNDEDVWNAAQRAGRFLVTQDLDFAGISRLASESHFSLLLVRLRFPSRLSLVNRVEELFQTESVEEWGDASSLLRIGSSASARRQGPGRECEPCKYSRPKP